MQFLVLGPLEVIAEGRTVALPAAKHRALLAALLVRADQAVPADGLIDALWEGQPPASAAKTLQTYVSQLRRELEPAAAAGGWRTLRTVEGGYRLHVDPDMLDAGRFERLAEEGRRALNRAEAATAAAWLREGLALWRGPAYGELAGAPFARAEAARLEELRLAALEWRAEAELVLGGHAELVGELEELVGREPFRERLWGHLMLALYRSGRQAEALRAYRRLRDSLADQLGIDPGPELRRLEERILRQDPSLDLAAPPAGPRDGPSRLPPVFAASPQAPLVGRDAELDRLWRAWEGARASGHRLVVVSGEPGIGKSRLAAELARLVLADGGEVLVGHADEEPMAPYQPFVEALGQHEGLAGTAARLPEAVRSRLARLLPAAVPGATSPESEDGELERFQLLAAVAALLAAMGRASPLLLVLEDLHWADRATLAMLLHLARSPERAALLVLVTARDGGLGVGGAWVEALAELRRHRLAELVTVRALDDGAVGGLVAGYVGHHPPARLVAMIGQVTDRNPFFVEELLRHLVETGAIDPRSGRWPAATAVEDLGIPEGVREVLARRLARLSAPTAKLLQVAAVLGREFEFTLLGRMTGWEDAPVIEAVEEALRAGVLSERGSSWVASYSFRHALVREALYGDLSLPRRQGLHLRAAAAIEASGPLDAARVAAAALHLRLAGPLADQAKVVEQSLRASEAAVAVYAWDEAVAHLRAAFEALERAGGPLVERARLAERLGNLVHQAGTDLEEGIGHLQWALAAYQAVGDRQAAARTHSRLGMHLTTYPATLDVAAGLAHYQAAEAELARQPGRRQLGYLYVGMAMGAVFGVRTERLEVASRRALELAEELGDEPLAGWAGYLRAWWAFNRGRLAESLSLHERMREVAARRDDVRMGSWVAFGRAILSGMYLADPLTAHAWCARGLALPHLEAFPRQRDSLLDHLGQAKGSSGELAAARRIAAGLDPGTLLERMLLYWSGDWEQAEAAWTAAADRDARSGDRLDGTLNAYWLGRVRRLLGAYEAAEAALTEGLAVALQGPQVPAEVMLRAELALLVADSGRLEAARAELARCQEIVQAGEDWRGLAGRVALVAGMLAAADGRPGEAGEAFAAAVETFHAYACSWDEAEAHCLWAKALPAEADRQRATAAGLYRRIGAARRWAAWAAEPVG
ncbi:MAG TPA: BTAD domain-containing putative transcriptional regulator [Actinomycetes bacterium]|jgi:DNA-binding SARP family transcriptional activator/energy-coupling factor transporter ATP-binding protein EcfA2|nr:BTAD domain-containing putative transcriptional regulator [Actinomycetes bacterium]